MSLDTYLVAKVGNSLYEVKRYKAGALLESATVDLMKGARSDFETKRLAVAKRYASEGCPRGAAYWFTNVGAISGTQLNESKDNPAGSALDEMATRKHFQIAANSIRAIEDPHKRQEMADFQAGIFSKDNPRFDHSRFHAAAGTQYKR
jgi:hypothetical protein